MSRILAGACVLCVGAAWVGAATVVESASVEAWVTGWEGGSSGWWSSRLRDDANAPGGTVTASSDNWPTHDYQYSGEATARCSGASSLGAWATARDPLNDRNGVNASADSRFRIEIEVTTAGTIRYPMSLSASLSIPTGDGWEYRAAINGSTNLRKVTHQYTDVAGMQWYPSAEIASGFFRTGVEEQVVDLLAGEYVRSGGVASISASRWFEATLEPGFYDLSVSLVGSAWSDGYGSGPYIASCDALNSMGFGGDFWDVVEGTAWFHDINNPDNKHIPEPATLLLVSALAACAMSRWRS